MTTERYNPVPFDVEASHRRWMKRPGFAAAYDALADEFAALGVSPAGTGTRRLLARARAIAKRRGMTRKTETEPMLRGHAKHRRTQSDYMGALLDRVTLETWGDVSSRCRLPDF